MSEIISTLTFLVGPAIARVILRRWLRDSDIAEELTGSLFDLIRSQTDDVRAQSYGTRQFEEIGEQIAISLLPVFETEFVGELNLLAITEAVATSLTNVGSFANLLVKSNLQPEILKEHILRSNSEVTTLFSEAEEKLYRRVIGECCEYIVDISSQLPHFTERTFAEILRRENQLLSLTKQLIAEVQRIREVSEQSNIQARAIRFEAEYRRTVVRNLDELELFGADVSQASRRHRLSIAYVSLSVSQIDDVLQEAIRDIRGKFQKKQKNLMVSSTSVEGMLKKTQLLHIRGLAGSGKTTLLKWVAIKSASHNFPNKLSEWNSTIPFFIRLRQCIEKGLPSPEEFPSLVAPAISGLMPPNWVHDRLIEGRGIVLIDGVDEVPTIDREKVRVWIRDLINTFPECRFIVSSRPSSVKEGWLYSENFTEAELLPMGLPEIYHFVNHWHKAVSSELGLGTNTQEFSSLSGNLKQLLKDNRSLRELASNPLLCSMLCALHRDRYRQIPQDRIELYEACIYMLLERREIERQIDLKQYPKLSYREKRIILEDLAYWLLKNNWQEIDQAKAEFRLKHKLSSLTSSEKDRTGQEIFEYLVERSGVVRQPAFGFLDFIHRTFQEYLAAHAIIHEGDIGLLIQKSADEYWREVVILAAGIANKRDRETIISQLIKKGDGLFNTDHYSLILAAACVSSSIDIDPTVLKFVNDKLAKLIPPTDLSNLLSLAAVGELAAKMLHSKTEYNSIEASMCVQTLTRIGTEAAVSTLESYKFDERPEVINALITGREFIQDDEEYIEKVLNPALSNLREWPNIDIRLLADLAGIISMPKLHVISGSCLRNQDLDFLNYFTGVTELRLWLCRQIKSIDPIIGLNNLRHLMLAELNQVQDFGALRTCSRLEYLELWGVQWFNNPDLVSNLSKLRYLRFKEIRELEDLTPIGNLSSLETLSISGCSKIKNIAPISELINLTHLELKNLPLVIDFEPLNKLTKLKQLKVSHSFNISLLSRELTNRIEVVTEFY